jgi:hypothetical protein
MQYIEETRSQKNICVLGQVFTLDMIARWEPTSCVMEWLHDSIFGAHSFTLCLSPKSFPRNLFFPSSRPSLFPHPFSLFASSKNPTSLTSAVKKRHTLFLTHIQQASRMSEWRLHTPWDPSLDADQSTENATSSTLSPGKLSLTCILISRG